MKPENIMVDPEDRIKLIDFGIAANEGSRRLTFAKLSNVMGTPDYISPEQVKGKRGDARSDIYAMGVMLYEMLTGKVPFTGNNPFLIMNDRLLNSPVPPREIDPAHLARAAGDHLPGSGTRSEEPLCDARASSHGIWSIRIRWAWPTARNCMEWKTAEIALAEAHPELRAAGAGADRDFYPAALGCPPGVKGYSAADERE